MSAVSCGSSASPPISGSGGAGSGGATPSGDSQGTGGKAGSGGASSLGGVTASGGKPGTGGTIQGGGSTGASCTSCAPCGGEVTGTWSVTSSCLAVTGEMDPSVVGLSCTTATVTGSLRVTGTFTAKADGTFVDNTTTSGTEQFSLAKECLVISSTDIQCDQAANVMVTLGYAEVTCTEASGGNCTCAAKVEHAGAMGLLDLNAATAGKYKTTGNTITLTSGDMTDQPYSYCVSGNTLTWTPQSRTPTLAGTIVFQKQGTTPGSGGAGGGTGGITASGGSMGAGGKTAAGGATGSGGGKATGGASGSGGSGAGGSTGTGTGPCDVLAAADSPCVAAHSTVRAMFASYSKALYQVKKVSDGTTKDISVLPGTGIADAAAQDAFCGTTARSCTISIIYDQTGNGNDLKVAQMCPTCSGCPSDASKKGQPDIEAFADGAKISIAGHPAYAVHILPCGNGLANQTGYRSTAAKNTATGDQPESVYFVVDGVNTNSGCCYDYGNSNPNGTASGNMDAIEFSKNKFWGYGAGSGPWVAADLEAGVYSWSGGSGSWQNPNSASLPYPFVTAILKNNQNGKTADEGPFVLKGGNAQSGTLTTMWSGARPNGYATMKKYGGIVLGIGGDGAAGAQGNFFEGALTATFNSKATDDALHANIIAAGYGK